MVNPFAYATKKTQEDLGMKNAKTFASENPRSIHHKGRMDNGRYKNTAAPKRQK